MGGASVLARRLTRFKPKPKLKLERIMNTKIKHGFSLVQMLLCIAIIGIITALALPAMAETGSVSFGVTNSVAAISTNTGASTVGIAVKIDNQEQVGLYFNGALTNSGTSAITIIIGRSVDGTIVETTPFFTWTLTANGTTAVTAYTNIPSALVGSTPYLKVTSIGNANANPLTNATLSVVKKNINR